MEAFNDLVLAVGAGLAAGGAAALARALPWPKSWKARKPLGCPTCMGGWMSMAALGYLVATDRLGVSLELGFFWLASTGIAAVVNGAAHPPEPALPDDFFKENP